MAVAGGRPLKRIGLASAEEVTFQGRSRTDTGRAGEVIAVRYLRDRGFRILARNWRTGRLEIDVVAMDADTVVFVEVRTRRPGPEPPEETVGPAKRSRLTRAAAGWIRGHPALGNEYRFDLVTIVPCPGGPPAVNHVPDAFQADRD